MGASTRHWRGDRGFGGQTPIACGRLSRREISVPNWLPSQGSSHYRSIPSLHPQSPATRHRQHHRRRQAPPQNPRYSIVGGIRRRIKNPTPACIFRSGWGFGFRLQLTRQKRMGSISPSRIPAATFDCCTTSKVCATHIVTVVT